MVIIRKHIATLTGEVYHVYVPKVMQLVDAGSVVSETLIGATDATITFSDGTTDIGVITIAAASAEAVVDTMVLDATSRGAVALGPTTPLYITTASGTSGAVDITMVFSEYHSS